MLKEKGYSDKTFREGKAPKQIATGLPLRVVITGEKKSFSKALRNMWGTKRTNQHAVIPHTHIPFQCLVRFSSFRSSHPCGQCCKQFLPREPGYLPARV